LQLSEKIFNQDQEGRTAAHAACNGETRSQ